MTAPERRRPLPALAVIGALCVLTAVVWFRVLHRSESAASPPNSARCPTSSPSAPAKPKDQRTLLPVPSKISVLVLNSTERTGLAGRTAKKLRKQGFKVTDAADDKPLYGGNGKPIAGVGEIRFGPTAKPAATLLHYLVPTAAMKQNDSSSGVVIISLGAQYKTFVPFDKVRKTLRKQDITLTRKPIRPPSNPTC
jgi:hypothetical protein